MTVSLTTRLGLTRWSSDSDPWSREQFDSNMGRLEALAVIYEQGPEADLPSDALAGGRFYVATDTHRIWYDNGDEWTEVATVDHLTGAIVAFAPTGGVSATTVQAAIAELDTEKAPKNAPVFTGAPQTIPAPATDLTTVLALTNALRTRFLDVGLGRSV